MNRRYCGGHGRGISLSLVQSYQRLYGRLMQQCSAGWFALPPAKDACVYKYVTCRKALIPLVLTLIMVMTGMVGIVGPVAQAQQGRMFPSEPQSLAALSKLEPFLPPSTVGRAGSAVLAVSADGRYMANAFEGFVKVWEISSGRVVQLLEGHPIQGGLDGNQPPLANSLKLAFSPDGRYLASISNHTGFLLDGLVVWELDSAARLSLFSNNCFDLVWASADTLVSACGYGVQFWQGPSFHAVESQTPIRTLIGQLALSPSGERLVTAELVVNRGDMERLTVWAVQNADLTPIATLKVDAYIEYMAFIDEAHLFTTSTDSRTSTIYNIMLTEPAEVQPSLAYAHALHAKQGLVAATYTPSATQAQSEISPVFQGTLRLPLGWIGQSFAWSQDGHTLVSVGTPSPNLSLTLMLNVWQRPSAPLATPSRPVTPKSHTTLVGEVAIQEWLNQHPHIISNVPPSWPYGPQTASNLMDLLTRWLSAEALTGESLSTAYAKDERLSVTMLDTDTSRIQLEYLGLADDSIKDERFTADVTRIYTLDRRSFWELQGLALQRRCWRGISQAWTTGLCP